MKQGRQRSHGQMLPILSATSHSHWNNIWPHKHKYVEHGKHCTSLQENVIISVYVL
jgi:hypothetical protein